MSTAAGPPAQADEVLLVEPGDRAVVLRLNRPRVHNALSPELLRRLDDEVRRADADPEVRVIVVAGTGGRAFSTGADLRHAAVDRARGAPELRARPDVIQPGAMVGFDALARCMTPVVAAIDGYCLAGGLELALLCDIRLATRASTFAVPEPHLGMLGGPAVVELSRAVPLGEAMWLHLSGERMSAERAFQIGLVAELLEDGHALEERVGVLVERIGAGSGVALEYVKHVVREGRELSRDQQWRFAAMYNAVLRGTHDSRTRAGEWVQSRH